MARSSLVVPEFRGWGVKHMKSPDETRKAHAVSFQLLRYDIAELSPSLHFLP